jgi:hypothetical protein
MLFSRRKPAVFQCSERTGAQLRRARTLGAALFGAGLILSACEAPESAEGAGAETVSREAVVTSSFAVPSPVDALVFLPNAGAPWTGLIAAGLSSGGFDIFNIDGQVVLSGSGPRLNGLSGVPAFALRGEEFPMLFGVDSDGALRGFVVAEQAEAIIELPLESAAEGEWASACLFETGIGFVDLALLGSGSQAAIVRIRDTGGEGLSVEERARFSLPFPARDCAAAQGDLIAAGPTAGLVRVSVDGDVVAEAAGLSIFDVTYSELLGRPAALTVTPDNATVSIYDANTLQPLANLETTAGLSTNGFVRPTALSATRENFGGMGFSTGLVAVYDREDGEVKLVAREVVSRAVVSPSG